MSDDIFVPDAIRCTVPSRVGVGEPFEVKIKLTGPLRRIMPRGDWNTWKPQIQGPFNTNVSREIHYLDATLPAWTGELRLDGGPAFAGPETIRLDGSNQGVFPGDSRPIITISGLRWTAPGFHFLTVIDPVSGAEGQANAALASEHPPVERLYWGDPHWQTFFSDGIRCPEELYAFARDEAFLDFGAITDHMEAVTDRQWDYFVAVTNDYNAPGCFATLVGQEWTAHAPGHRNVYVRGDAAPPLRSTDPGCNTLEKLRGALDGLEALAIPHHTANAIMGADWGLGWDPRHETAVEIYSVWGSSECHADDGNPRPIQHCNGEVRGRHVIDALKAGYRFGFVGGGDIHDGRPGEAVEHLTEQFSETWPSGLTAAFAPALTREAIFDALRDRRTYATTNRRIYLEAGRAGRAFTIRAAAEDGIDEAAIIRNGACAAVLRPDADPRILLGHHSLEDFAPGDFVYARVRTRSGDMAWSSPCWGGEE